MRSSTAVGILWTMDTTVCERATSKVICPGCEDTIPATVVVRVNELSYCRLCAFDVMRSELTAIALELQLGIAA